MSALQTIIVTGASKGIGYELTKRFLDMGHSVIAVSRSTDRLLMLSETCNNLTVLSLDITKSIDSLVETLKGKKVDHVVNNAGYLINKGVSELSDEEIRRQYEVNAIAPLRIARDLLPLFRKGSTICNISSMGGVQGTAKFPGLSAYSSSKGALSVLTECLAEELKEKGVRCNALALGAVQTEMLEAAFPGYVAPVSSFEMASYISEFVLVTSKYYNGKVLPVSTSTP